MKETGVTQVMLFPFGDDELRMKYPYCKVECNHLDTEVSFILKCLDGLADLQEDTDNLHRRAIIEWDTLPIIGFGTQFDKADLQLRLAGELFPASTLAFLSDHQVSEFEFQRKKWSDLWKTTVGLFIATPQHLKVFQKYTGCPASLTINIPSLMEEDPIGYEDKISEALVARHCEPALPIMISSSDHGSGVRFKVSGQEDCGSELRFSTPPGQQQMVLVFGYDPYVRISVSIGGASFSFGNDNRVDLPSSTPGFDSRLLARLLNTTVVNLAPEALAKSKEENFRAVHTALINKIMKLAVRFYPRARGDFLRLRQETETRLTEVVEQAVRELAQTRADQEEKNRLREEAEEAVRQEISKLFEEHGSRDALQRTISTTEGRLEAARQQGDRLIEALQPARILWRSLQAGNKEVDVPPGLESLAAEVSAPVAEITTAVSTRYKRRKCLPSLETSDHYRINYKENHQAAEQQIHDCQLRLTELQKALQRFDTAQVPVERNDAVGRAEPDVDSVVDELAGLMIGGLPLIQQMMKALKIAKVDVVECVVCCCNPEDSPLQPFCKKASCKALICEGCIGPLRAKKSTCPFRCE
jgi:hypothetical protein